MVWAPFTLSFHFFALQILRKRSLRGQPLHKFLKSEASITIKVESSNNSHHFLRCSFAPIFLQKRREVFLINVTIVPVINSQEGPPEIEVFTSCKSLFQFFCHPIERNLSKQVNLIKLWYYLLFKQSSQLNFNFLTQKGVLIHRKNRALGQLSPQIRIIYRH